ncbi:MAG: hypothetical protein GEU75_13340 [Dehalococcoidia bacterium]|nr:hypothetical protein [Dehalococcoidia bacterium]
MRQGRPRHPDILTPREWQVFDLISEGLTNEEIANRLGISIHGARYHVAEILSKLGVSSREEAVRVLANRKPGLGLWPSLEWFRAKLPIASKPPMSFVMTPGLAAAAVGLVAAFMLFGPWSFGASSDGSTVLDRVFVNRTEPSVDVLIEDSDTGAFLTLSGQVEQTVIAMHPDAVLKQVDVHGANEWIQFRFLTTTASCEEEFAPADDPDIRGLYADKCDIFVTVPAGARSDPWHWQERDAWQGDMGTQPLDLASVLVGPDAVKQAALAQWPGCTPTSMTLADSGGQLTWTAFCSKPDGGMFSGTANARIGDFVPSVGGPVYPPPTAPASR